MKTRKFIATLLSVAMIAAAVPSAVFADDTEITDESEVTEQVIEDPEATEPEEPEDLETTSPEDQTEDVVPDTFDSESGMCGDYATWTLDDEGTLTISGTGAISIPISEYSYSEEIKRIVIGNGITSIGDEVFYGFDNVTTVSIPDSVTSIGVRAFQDCYEIVSIDIPDSVTSIGTGAFYDCNNLETVNIQATSNLRSIGDEAFSFCFSLRSIFIPKKVNTIGEKAFYCCHELASVDISFENAITSFGNFAFHSCLNLKTFTIPLQTTSIGKGIFNDCTSLSDVYLLSGNNNLTWEDAGVESNTTVHVDSVRSTWSWAEGLGNNLKEDLCGYYAIWNYDADTKTLTISGYGDMSSYALDSTTSNAPWACYAEDIEKVVIGNAITSVGRSSFAGLYNLTEVVFEETSQVQYIHKEAFAHCTSLTSISIPFSVEYICERAFMYCSNLETVTIDKESNLTKILTEAFKGCEKLNGIIIPRNVRLIENDAFYGCEGMTDIYCYANPANKLDDREYFYQDDTSNAYIDFRHNTPLTRFHILQGSNTAYLEFTEYLVVTFVDDITEMGDGVDIMGHSLSLKGDIGVNFYLELAADILADSESYVLFTLADGTTQKVLVSEAATDTETVLHKTCKVFQCDVAPKQMGDTITAQVFMGDDTARGEAFSYTVYQYVDEINTEGSTYSIEARHLVKAMASYGAYSQVYFGYPNAAAAAEALDNYHYDIDYEALGNHLNLFGPSSISAPSQLAGVSIELETEVNMRLWFKNIPAGSKFLLQTAEGPVELPARRKGIYTIVTVSDIAASDLDKPFMITVVIDDEALDTPVTYNPMNYCYAVIHHETDEVYTEDLQKLVNALHIYNYFANEYVDG